MEPWVAVCDGGQVTRNSCWVHVGSYPISTGESDSNWHLGGPFELQNSVGTGGDTFRSTITPVACNYEPCGESLDCFADCISGTKGCDGVTPAHKPVIYFTLSILGCCLNGTYPLRFSGNGYYGTITCESPFGSIHTLDVAVKCCFASTVGSISDTGNLVCLVLNMETAFPGTGYPPLTWSLIKLVPMGCTDGVLNEASGTLTGSDCGLTGDGEWVIHG